MRNLKNYGVLALGTKETRGIDGGGIIKDLVHWFKCSCNHQTNGGTWNSFYGGVNYN